VDLKRNNLVTYGIIAALLVLSGIAVVVVPSISDQISGALGSGGGPPAAPDIEVAEEPTIVTIDIQDLLLGEELMAVPFLADLDGTTVRLPVLVGILTGIFVALTLPVGAVLFLVYTRLDNTTTATKGSESFKEASSRISDRQAAFIKQNMQEKPPKEIPSHTMPRWSVISTALIAVFFGLMLGAMLGLIFVPSGEIIFELGETEYIWGPAGVFGWSFGLIALLFSMGYIRSRRLLAVDDTDYGSINWAAIWVIISGVILLGFGLGAVLAFNGS
jgi:hypothetical protein